MSRRFGRRSTNLTEEAESIVLDIYPDLRKFAAVVADLDVDPDDLVQDALVAVLKKTSLDVIDDPLAYLKRVVVNLSMSNRRRAARWKDLLPRAATSIEHRDLYPSDALPLTGLSTIDKAALYMAEVDGYSHDHIAEVLDLSVLAVAKRLSRARKKLRTELTINREIVEASI